MKFMKLGIRPDTFYTEEATRKLISDIPSDLVIRINNVRFFLHKYPLVPKCGLLQQLCSDDSQDTSSFTVELHDIPGGADGFELCAKFCYGITLSLGAHNIVVAFCAAKYLRMTEVVEKGNFGLKLESFLNTCILRGWKDSIATLQTTIKLPDWSENLGIVRTCTDSIVEMILTPPSKVTWSYTYTRSGYVKKDHHSVPKDWWTEDISNLNIELFQSIISAIKSVNMLSSQLIGEALHVYASRWLPEFRGIAPSESSTSTSQTEQSVMESRRVFESIASMIPAERGSVSIGFLLRLLGISNNLKVSSKTKDLLIRRSSLQLDEATVNELLLASYSGSSKKLFHIDLVEAVLASFLVIWKRQVNAPLHGSQHVISIARVGKLIDSYLQVVAKDSHMPVSRIVSLAEMLPEVARPVHDDLYKAVNIYLKEHPDLSKEEKKRLCRIMDCQKLSKEVRVHAVKNERLPLRTVVQTLFFEQERGDSSAHTSSWSPHELLSSRGQKTVVTTTKAPNANDAQHKTIKQPHGMRSEIGEMEPEKGSVRTKFDRANSSRH